MAPKKTLFEDFKIKRIAFTGLFILLFSFESRSEQCRDAFASLTNGQKRTLPARSNGKKYTQYVVKQSSEEIVSYFYYMEDIPLEAISEDGIYYGPDISEYIKSFTSLFYGKTITMQNARELFNEALQMEEIIWSNTLEACNARAHLMSRKFESLGVYVDKVWPSGSILIKEGADFFEWSFHVAPVVYVKSAKGKIVKIVIDPSLFDEPVLLDKWVDKLNFYQHDVVRTSFPPPLNSSDFGIMSLSLSNSDAIDIITPWPDLTEEDKIFHSYECINQLKNRKIK